MKESKVADALSCKGEQMEGVGESLAMILFLDPIWTEELKNSYFESPKHAEILAHLKETNAIFK